MQHKMCWGCKGPVWWDRSQVYHQSMLWGKRGREVFTYQVWPCHFVVINRTLQQTRETMTFCLLYLLAAAANKYIKTLQYFFFIDDIEYCLTNVIQYLTVFSFSSFAKVGDMFDPIYTPETQDSEQPPSQFKVSLIIFLSKFINQCHLLFLNLNPQIHCKEIYICYVY